MEQGGRAGVAGPRRGSVGEWKRAFGARPGWNSSGESARGRVDLERSL